jgi:ElaB/YqjD/DUF883 family membrane-anchored ribosome-binding protein
MASTSPYGESSMRKDAEERARSVAANVSERASDLASKAGEQLDRAMESGQDVARDMAERGREGAERMQQVAGNLKSAVDKSVREQPMATLAMAAGMGFLLGALWKS